MFLDDSNAVVSDCFFTLNYAEAGAGGAYSFFRDESAFIRCIFDSNDAGAGGAMYLETSYAGLQSCQFLNNTARNGGALFVAKDSEPLFQDCTFDGNDAAPFSGGAADVWTGADPVFLRCSFTRNTATLRGGGGSSQPAINAPAQSDKQIVRTNSFTSHGSRITSDPEHNVDHYAGQKKARQFADSKTVNCVTHVATHTRRIRQNTV